MRTILVSTYHNPSTKDRLLSTNALEADHGIYHDPITSKLIRANREQVGLVKKVNGLPWIDSPLFHGVKSEAEDIKTEISTKVQKTHFYEPNSSSKSNDKDKDLNRVSKAVSTYEIHRRLGHIGKPYIKASLADTILLNKDNQVKLYDFDCEAYQLRKAKKRISRDKQRRIKKPGIKFHANT